jgi:elongation factor P
MQATLMRVGMVIIHRGDLCRVMSVQHVTPGNKRGFVQAKLRNLATGSSFEHKFRSEDNLEKAHLEKHPMQYLYENGGQYCFMNENTYEQVLLSGDDLGDQVKFLIPEVVVSMEFHDGKPMGVDLPTTVDLKVTSTDPGLKGATATNSPKPATLETGLFLQVPQFINEGDVIRVETATGKYLTRAKD